MYWLQRTTYREISNQLESGPLRSISGQKTVMFANIGFVNAMRSKYGKGVADY